MNTVCTLRTFHVSEYNLDILHRRIEYSVNLLQSETREVTNSISDLHEIDGIVGQRRLSGTQSVNLPFRLYTNY